MWMCVCMCVCFGFEYVCVHNVLTNISMYIFHWNSNTNLSSKFDFLATNTGESTTTIKCQSNEIMCVSDGRCIEAYKYCNGIVDCNDATDEENCSGHSFYLCIKTFNRSLCPAYQSKGVLFCFVSFYSFIIIFYWWNNLAFKTD